MHQNFEPKIVYMQNNKQTQSLVASHAVVFPGEEGNTTPLKTTAWEAVVEVTSNTLGCRQIHSTRFKYIQQEL